MQKTSVTRKVESDLLLNIQDINKFKATTADTKIEQRKVDIESGLEKYNKSYIDAWEAPVPDISLHYNEVLLRAVPVEIKSKGGLITSVGETDLQIGGKLNRMSDAIDQVQEILMVGTLITDAEQIAGMRPGRMCKLRLDRFRTVSDEHKPGMIEMQYDIPLEVIDGQRYLLVDKRDLMYTKDK